MKPTAIVLTAIAVVAVPIAVQGQSREPAERRYCEISQPTGSRLGAVRRCRTKAERDAAKAEGKSTVERIQSQKNYTEAMAGMGARAMCRSSPRGC